MEAYSETLETGTILQRFESSSKSLQKVESDLDTIANIYCSLEEYVSDLRDIFNDINLQAFELCGQDENIKKTYDEVFNDSACWWKTANAC